MDNEMKKCIRCPTIHSENGKKCERCRVRDNEAAKRCVNKKAKKDGICKSCFIEFDNNLFSTNPKTKQHYRLCDKCREKSRFYRKQDIDKKKEIVSSSSTTILCILCKTVKEIDGNFSKKRNGQLFNTCDSCRKNKREYAENNLKCQHGISKYRCKKCDGSALCEHDVIKSECKKCLKSGNGGGSFCQHDKRRDRCKQCFLIGEGGGSFCQHIRLWYNCSICCKSKLFCEHKKRRQRCPTCCPGGHYSEMVRSRIFKRIRICLYNISHDFYVDDLGCSIRFYISYLEKKFKEGMTWDNYGKVWHIDHTEPIKYDGDDSIETVKKRLVYTNTQPLFVDENIAKSNKFIG